MENQYCPNVDRPIVGILLDLIDLAPMHAGIDFNLLGLLPRLGENATECHEVSTVMR